MIRIAVAEDNQLLAKSLEEKVIFTFLKIHSLPNFFPALVAIMEMWCCKVQSLVVKVRFYFCL